MKERRVFKYGPNDIAYEPDPLTGRDTKFRRALVNAGFGGAKLANGRPTPTRCDCPDCLSHNGFITDYERDLLVEHEYIIGSPSCS